MFRPFRISLPSMPTRRSFTSSNILFFYSRLSLSPSQCPVCLTIRRQLCRGHERIQISYKDRSPLSKTASYTKTKSDIRFRSHASPLFREDSRQCPFPVLEVKPPCFGCKANPAPEAPTRFRRSRFRPSLPRSDL